METHSNPMFLSGSTYSPVIRYRSLAVVLLFSGLFLLSGLQQVSATSPWMLIEIQAQEVFEKVSPCVVGIIVKPAEKIQVVDPGLLPPDSLVQSVSASREEAWDDYLDSLFSRERLATGLVVNASGYILTTASVIRSVTNEKVSVLLTDGIVLSATPVAVDEYTNLAILKVDHQFNQVPSFGNSSDLKIGSFVLAITRPYGRSNSFFTGTISNLGQELGLTVYENLIQTSVPLHPGSIGSPILNLHGEILGILSTTQKQSSWPELSFAIPSDMLSFITHEVISKGSITRGFLGVYVSPLTHEIRTEKDLPKELQGVYVTNLIENGPAQKAGILPGDIITQFNNHDIYSYQQLVWQTAVAPQGQGVEVQVWRGGEEIAFLVSLQKLTQAHENP